MSEHKLDDSTRRWAVGISDRLGLCPCGTGKEWSVVHAILLRAKNRNASFYDEMAGVPGEWVEFAAKVLDEAGLLEHGGSIAWAWLTGDGERLLEYLDANNGKWVDCDQLYLRPGERNACKKY